MLLKLDYSDLISMIQFHLQSKFEVGSVTSVCLEMSERWEDNDSNYRVRDSSIYHHYINTASTLKHTSIKDHSRQNLEATRWNTPGSCHYVIIDPVFSVSTCWNVVCKPQLYYNSWKMWTTLLALCIPASYGGYHDL